MMRELGVKAWSKGKSVDDVVQPTEKGKTMMKKKRMGLVMRRG